MSAPLSNRFLSSLSPHITQEITPLLTAVSLPQRTSLFEPGQMPKYAYFITSGFASVVTAMEDGGTAEVEIIGREGITGAVHLLGSAGVPTSCFIQMAGTGLRMEMAELRRAIRTHEEMHDRLLELVQSQLLAVSQMAGCNRLHEAEARLARWVLMASDRCETDVLYLTQEFLAEMLGAQRTTVTMVAGSLQRAGLIEYQHGKVKIKDRASLERAACECYGVVKRLLDEMYKKPARTIA